jgi:hypothetical protein
VRRPHLHHLVAVLAGLLALSLAYPTSAITNSEPDNGEHPYAGVAVFDEAGVPSRYCSGTLLSATVFLTAGHCTDGADTARVWVDERVQDNAEFPDGGATSYEGVPHTNPDFCRDCGDGLPGSPERDVGIVVLTEPVPTSLVDSYGRLPLAGLVDDLQVAAAVDLVGYGAQVSQQGDGQGTWAGALNRRQADSRLVAGSFAQSDEFVRVRPGADQGGLCFGDSGGPVLTDEGTTILAVHSHAQSSCTGLGYSQRVDISEVLSWIESFR